MGPIMIAKCEVVRKTVIGHLDRYRQVYRFPCWSHRIHIPALLPAGSGLADPLGHAAVVRDVAGDRQCVRRVYFAPGAEIAYGLVDSRSDSRSLDEVRADLLTLQRDEGDDDVTVRRRQHPDLALSEHQTSDLGFRLHTWSPIRDSRTLRLPP